METVTHPEEWRRLLTQGLIAEEQQSAVTPPDPFQALKSGAPGNSLELQTRWLMHWLLAGPWQRGKLGFHLPSGFSGHRLLFRELNLLRAALQMVYAILSQTVESPADSVCRSLRAS